VDAALLSAAALWIQTRVALRAGTQARRLDGAPLSRIRRQISLPSAISQSAISWALKIHRAWPAALYFEQIDACLMLAPAQTQAQVGG
jgi:hypothetical protein